MGLQLAVRRLGEFAVVEVRGDVDAENSATLQEYLNSALQEHSHRMIVDLGGLTSVDAPGLSALAVVERRAIKLGGMMCLARPQEPVAKMLHLTGLDQYFLIYPTPEAAATRP